MRYDPFTIGGMIQEIRLDRKLTQLDMAEKLDVSLGHYAKMEEGARGLSLDLLFKIMTVLNVDANTLLLYGASGTKRVENVFAKLTKLKSFDRDMLMDSVELMVDSMCRSEEKRLVS